MVDSFMTSQVEPIAEPMTTKGKNGGMKKIISNLTTAAMFGFFIGAVLVADKNIATVLMAVTTGLAVFLLIIDRDIRRKL